MKEWVCQILKGIAVTGFFCLQPTTVTARGWYFSDCKNLPPPLVDHDTGCAKNASLSVCNGLPEPGGTINNPWCPDVEGNGTWKSAAYISQTASNPAPDVAAGDTIYLCSGACDGAGTTGQIKVGRTAPDPFATNPCATDTWLYPRRNGPITVMSYPGERVTILGDEGAFAHASYGPQNLIGGANGYSGWTFKDFNLLRSYHYWVCIDNAGAPGWTFENMQFREANHEVWGDGDGIASGDGFPCTDGVNNCQCGAPGSSSSTSYGMYITNQNTNKLTIKNNYFYASCGSMLRMITSPSSEQADGNYSAEITGNTFENGSIAIEFWKFHNILIANNTFNDIRRAIGPENEISYIDIQDNTINCKGQYKTYWRNACQAGIAIEWGDGTQATFHNAHHVRVKRNRVQAWGVDANKGHFRAGITTQIRCDQESGNTCAFASAPEVYVENNVVGGVTIDDQSGSAAQYSRAAIGIWAFNPITVRNNTVYDSTYAYVLDGTSTGTSTFDFDAYNNISYVTASGGASVVLMPNAIAKEAKLTYNNFYSPTTSNPMVKYCTAKTGANDSDTECLTVGTTCTYAAGYAGCLSGAGNKIAASEFMDPANPTPFLRDYHLAPIDTNNVDAGTSFFGNCSTPGDGIECDMDKNVRPVGTAFDIGAYESLVVDGGFEGGSFGVSGGPQRAGASVCQRGAYSSAFRHTGANSMRLLFDLCTADNWAVAATATAGWYLDLTNLDTTADYCLQYYTYVDDTDAIFWDTNSYLRIMQSPVTTANSLCNEGDFGAGACNISVANLGNTGAWILQSSTFRPENASTRLRFHAKSNPNGDIFPIYTDDVRVFKKPETGCPNSDI